MTPSKRPSPSFSQQDLINACDQPGCPVCRVGANSVNRYLKSIFNEYVNDPTLRDHLLKSLGFCVEHTQLLLNTRTADPLGASIIYENIVKKILRELPHKSKSNEFKRASTRTGNCMACEQQEALFDRSLDEIRKTLGEEKMRNALQDSEGLCFPHLTQVLERIKDTDDVEFLLALTKTQLEIRQTEMAEVIRKNDHRFQSEGITEDEALAWKKTMCMITGVNFS